MTTVVWFRRDLRLDANPAWAEAVATDADVVALYVRDATLLDRAGPHRRSAYEAAVDALAGALDGALVVREGDPAAVLPAVVAEAGAATLAYNRDVTPYATARDGAVLAALDGTVAVHGHWGTLVHPPGSIRTNAGHVPRVFGAFWKRWRDREVPEEDEPAAPHPDLDAFVAEHLGAYPTDRDRPAVRGTSELSIGLKLGTISPVTVVRRAREHAATGADPEPFVRQLAWRDWYAHLLAESPGLVERAQVAAYDRIEWRDAPDELAAWQSGRTGVPIVDAGMRQLHETGWMHNRVRMLAASFLVKDLLIDWRHGERWFRHWLADADVPQNVGNWQWVAGTGPDAAPYFRVFNPVTQSRRFDPDGTYLRRWVPELAALDDTAVHEPSALGPMELAAAGITLGVDYPEPLVDHGFARQRAIDAYARARRDP